MRGFGEFKNDWYGCAGFKLSRDGGGWRSGQRPVKKRKKLLRPTITKILKYFRQLDSGIQWQAQVHEPRGHQDIPELPSTRIQDQERQEKDQHEPRGKSRRTREPLGRCELHEHGHRTKPRRPLRRLWERARTRSAEDSDSKATDFRSVSHDVTVLVVGTNERPTRI